MKKRKNLIAVLLAGALVLSAGMPVSAEDIAGETTGTEVLKEAEMDPEADAVSGSEKFTQPEMDRNTQESNEEIPGQETQQDNLQAVPESGSDAEDEAAPASLEDEAAPAVETENSVIAYHTHVQTYGWQDWVEDGAMSGTEGQAKRLEGIEIKLKEQKYPGGIQYRTHVQTYGWQDWVEDGAMSGTSGQAKRLEAIEIRLTGEMAEHYDIYYHVHAQTFGWMGWAVNGGRAGSAGYAKRLEGIEIVLVEKGQAAPGSTENAFRHTNIQYQTHVQTYGWQSARKDGEMSGTAGLAKRLEGIKIQLANQEYEGGIRYCTHVQTYGWQDWVENGAMSGTSGQAKRLEAIRIELTGEMAEHYDVYYRVHAQTYGWLSWVKNGEQSGTSGLAKRLEAIEIQILPKGAAAPAGNREQPAIAYTNTAQKTSQILLVNAHGGTSANVQLWEKQGPDWLKARQTSGFVGSKGVGKPSAYISRTPAGAYTLGFAFGINGNPGTKLDYRQITNNSYWIGDVNDPLYNTWQEKESGHPSDEHLIDYRQQYEFAITLDFDNGYAGGSAFFLHVSNGIPTGGCVSVPRSEMLYLMRNIEKGAYIINVNSESELAKY